MPGRLPTEIHELTGSFQHNPDRGRARADEPRDTPPLDLDAEPVCLNPLELMTWRDIVRRAHRNVIREADADALIITAKIVTAAKYCEGCPDPKVAALAAKYLGLFGLTPADRSRVSAPKGNEAPSKYGKFGQPRLVT